jgi:catechol 1,2-dioxygenase
LVREVRVVDDVRDAERYGVANPFRLLEFDVVLDPVSDQGRS